jgi:hypothetical protein
VNILQAIVDPQLFKPFLGNLVTWSAWESALSVLYGLPVKAKSARDLVRTATGRLCGKLPADGFKTALFLTGRRSGKSRIAAVIAAYEAVLSGREKLLAPGELGIVAVLSPTKSQSRIVHGYIRAIFDTPLLKAEVVAETATTFELKNGVRIEILTGDHRAIRGFTLLACVCDELAFFGVSEESKVKSDTELVRALLPGLATTHGRLICISSPYARKGQCWRWFQKHHSNNGGKVLVWNCGSKVMNPTLPQTVIDAAMAEDLAAAKSEYGGEFRDDISLFIPREVVEAVVVKGRAELMPRQTTIYSAFCDLSGGRSDDATLCIGHREQSTVIVDKLIAYRAPFDPSDVISQMALECKKYSIRAVTGDNYAGEFVRRAFIANRLGYRKCEKPKSALYLEFLPRLCSGLIELPDDAKLIDQICNLERRTRSGGKDQIDHAPGNHDDLANAVAGLADLCGKPQMRVGGGFNGTSQNPTAENDVAIVQRRVGLSRLAVAGIRASASRFSVSGV